MWTTAPRRRPGALSSAAVSALLATGLLVAPLGAPAAALGADPGAPGQARTIELSVAGDFRTGIFGASAAEIVAYDARTQRIFAIGATEAVLHVADIGDPSAPAALPSIDLSAWGPAVNSVAVDHGLIVAAVEAADRQLPGTAVFLTTDGAFLSAVSVGANPDMLTFTPGGSKVLVANEGEPSGYGPGEVDPEGSVSIIDLADGAADLADADVTTVGFGDFNVGGPRHGELDPAIRIFGPGASVAQDLEPEYVAVAHDGLTAWVTLQENNALAIIDVTAGRVTSLVSLGRKDHSLVGNGLDPSDRDGGIHIANWPVSGMYMPDGIAAYRSVGATYLVTANEGDARDWPGLAEEARVSSLALDPAVFPNAATLKANANLGRLTVSKASGDTDGDGDYDRLDVFGARSFSIWTAGGTLVFDSGDALERVTAAAFPAGFNSTNDANSSFDTRSDNKGPEPEGVAIGEVRGRTYAFVGLERIGGVVVFDVSIPTAPTFVQYINPRDFAGSPAADTAGDLGPEGLTFVSGSASPTTHPLLLVANEVSGSVTVYEVTPVMP